MHKQNEKLLNKEWLKDQYEIQQKSLRTIANELGVTTPIVSKYVRRYGFAVRSAGESKAITSTITGPKSYNNGIVLTKEWLEEQYVTKGKSLRLIAKEFDLHRSLIKKAIKFHNIQVRDLKDARHNRTLHGRCNKTPNPTLVQNYQNIIDSYHAGESIRSIRHRLKLSRDAVTGVLVGAGIKLRNANEARVGSKHSPETKKKMSDTAVNQILSGKRTSHSHGNRMTCLTPNNGFIVMRSSWEKKYAEYLKANNVNFSYESRIFPLSNSKSYVADFHLTDTNEYIEVKGYLSQEQKAKYDLFRNDYPDVSWKMLGKDELTSCGVNFDQEIPTVYMLIGAPSAGKSWVAKQLKDKFDYVSFDDVPKKQHLDRLRAPSDKPKLYDPTFKISTIIRRHSHEFNFVLVAIYETEETLRSRIAQRGGTWTDTIMKRNEVSRKRYDKYGAEAGGFIGTSSDALEFLRAQVELFNSQNELD